VITVGPMALNQPQAADPMEPFFLGTQTGGGYWTDISRLSSHDHSGGLMGAPVAVTIPDGSITTADLDPSVLAPYAPTDGSKPFTGQVTMQADAVLRDALFFGQQGTALAPDVSLTRTGAAALRVDTNLGVGVAPAAWSSGFPALQVGGGGGAWGNTGGAGLWLTSNTFYDGVSRKQLIASQASVEVSLGSSGLSVLTAPGVAAGAAQTQTTRAQIAQTGTLTLTPDAGQNALTANGHVRVAVPAATAPLDWTIAGTVRGAVDANGSLTVTPNGATVAVLADPGSLGFQGPRMQNPQAATLGLYGGGGSVTPLADNGNSLGAGTFRWTTVFAVAGAINTSSREAKTAVAPLDPAAAMAAVRATDAVTFEYLPPERAPEWYELPDDPEEAERVLHQRAIDLPAEAAARHQAGFVAEDAADLFLVGPGQTAATNSVGVLLGALHDLDARLTALEEGA
jgi:hypothetical protein